MHYLISGGASFRFSARKQEFLIPVIILLRALSGADAKSSINQGGFGSTDEEIFRRIMQGDESNTFLRARAELLLQDANRFEGLNTPEECLAYLGARFRAMSLRADSTSDVDVGHYMIRRYVFGLLQLVCNEVCISSFLLLKNVQGPFFSSFLVTPLILVQFIRYVLVHLSDYRDKLECMFLLLRKLYSFAANECSTDNADSLQNQEILLPGHLITSFVKEKFEEMLIAIRLGFLKEMQGDYGKLIAKLHDSVFWNKAIDRFGNLGSGGIGRKVQVFLSTGNIVSSTGLDLMQVSGYTIVAERLNFLRYCVHFRSVHRGQFFMEMKTTSVRKLLPDQWGFLCPVHTPDGGPCGLLSHLALKCKVLADAAVSGSKDSTLDDVLISLGVSPVCTHSESGGGGSNSVHLHLPVCVDGRVAGRLPARQMKTLAARLRRMKIEGDGPVPATLEIVCIPSGEFDLLQFYFPFVDYCQFTLTTVSSPDI